VQIRWEKESCVSCGACQSACPVNLPPEKISVSAECIKCGKCVDACPAKCLKFCGKRDKGNGKEENVSGSWTKKQ